MHAENNSSHIFICGSIDPPTSKKARTLTAFLFSGWYLISNIPAFLAVELMVPSKSNSSSALSRINFLNLLRATFIFLVPNSTLSSRFLKSLASQTLTAFPFLPSPPTLMPSGWSPSLPNGEVPSVPTHLSPPSCLSSCSCIRFLNSSKSFSRPPRDLIFSSSSSVRYFSNSALSQSSGINISKMSSILSIPLK